MTTAARLAVALRDGSLTLPADGPIAVLRGTIGAIGVELPRARLRVEQGFRPDFEAIEAAGVAVTRRLTEPAAMVLVQASRARARSLGDMARGLDLLAPGGVLALDGAKTDGIDALARKVGAALPLAGQVTKAHGRLIWLHRPAVLPPEVADWAAAAALHRNAAGFETAPGMFSPEAPDPGSERLAAHLAGRLQGRVADLGAGWGWLSAQALAQCPGITEIALIEADAEALDAARRNITDRRATFHWADVARLSRDAAGFDVAISNPPFHHGRAAEPALGAAFIAAAARILKPAGRLLLVANRQLPYEAPLSAAFGKVELLDADRHYKVIAASRPRSAAIARDHMPTPRRSGTPRAKAAR